MTATASNGVATFSGLTLLSTAASYYYSLYVSGGGFGWGVTSTIAVTPAGRWWRPRRLPASVTAGSSFGLRASIEDPYGNAETDNSDVITAALASNPTGTTLGGTLSATVDPGRGDLLRTDAHQGVATFSGLTLNKVGTGYTLEVTSKWLSSATTPPSL